MALHGKRSKTEKQRAHRSKKPSRQARLERRAAHRRWIFSEAEASPGRVDRAHVALSGAGVALAAFAADGTEESEAQRAALENTKAAAEKVYADAVAAALVAVSAAADLRARLDSYAGKAA